MSLLQERQAGVLQIRPWALRGRLYAIVDATDTPSVPIRARRMGGQQAVSLYRGRAEEEWFAIAPFLFQVDRSTLDWITGDLWSGPWGIFAVSGQSLDALRTHFRRFLVVEAPTGESWYFRFYDPRVLVKFLPACTDPELAELFGPVRAFGVTDPETYGIKIFTRAGAVQPMAAPQPVVVHR